MSTEDRAFRVIICQYKKNASRRNVEWNLSDDAVRSLVIRNCHYCGAVPDRIASFKIGDGRKGITYNGIDRKDNSLGYTPDNSVPCCFQCNRAKGQASVKEFIEWIQRAAAYMEKVI